MKPQPSSVFRVQGYFDEFVAGLLRRVSLEQETVCLTPPLSLMRFLPFFLALFCVTSLSAQLADQKAPKIKPGVRSSIQFTESTPQSSAAQLKLRMRSSDDPGPYDLSRESFQILVPRGYKESEPHGLFVWISAGDQPSISADWEKTLADQKLIFIGAVNSGNKRPVFDRIRLAVDANHHVRQLYNIDANRVYISGHSGGSRVASMMGVAYADMFTGAACFMGVNFFMPTQGKDGTMFEARYVPHLEIASIAQQQNRFALITGDKDFNRDNTQAIYEQGFVANQFKGVKLFDIPNQGHNAPSKEWLEKVLQFLDTGK